MDKEKYLVDKKRAFPVKVFSSQLRDGQCCYGYQGKMECNIKNLCQAKSSTLVVSVIWMQGTVLEMISENSARLLDETGTFVVNGVRNIPKGKSDLCQGEIIFCSPLCCLTSNVASFVIFVFQGSILW